MERDSVFKSMIRGLCKSFGVLIGVFLATVFVILFLSILSPVAHPKHQSKLFLSMDETGNDELLPAKSPAILKINIEGIIGVDQLTTESVQRILIDSRKGFLSQDRVKAVFIFINSPGGTVSDSAGIAEAILQYKKQYSIPVYAFVDGLCASGGMYIASSADKVFATNSSVIGSVGVLFGPSFNVSELMSKVGIQALTITQGKDKDMLTPFRPWKENESESLASITKTFYEQFVAAVTQGRPHLSKESLISEYGAQVFASSKAEELGFVDVSNATYFSCMAALKKEAQIEEEYQVVELSIPRSFFSELAESKFSFLQKNVSHSFELDAQIPSQLHGKFLYLYKPFSL